MNKWFAVALVALLSACGARLDGTYSDGFSNYTFKSGGKVAVVSRLGESELDYKVEDGKVKIGLPQGDLVMTILDDGSIQGPMDMKLTKKK